MTRIAIIGSGPAGISAALRAAELGAEVTLVSDGEFGGMASNDGPVPVRTLAHVARLMRDARQLPLYGVGVGEPKLDYERMLARVREVTADFRKHSTRREDFGPLGVKLIENAGASGFVDPHAVATAHGQRIEADRFILCTGGVSRKLPILGFELTATHSDAWKLKAAPPSMIVIGAGATGAQVASIFNAFGTKVQLFQAGPRILPTEDEAVSVEMAAAFRANGVEVREDFGAIDRFEATACGVRMHFSKDGRPDFAEAAAVIVAIGWVANTGSLHLAAAGVELNARGFIAVDDYLRTSASHIFAAGDVTGRLMLVSQAVTGGYAAATNAVGGPQLPFSSPVNPVGSFTDPEYAQVGLTEAEARKAHEIVLGIGRFDEVARTIIDGRKIGFCKVIVDRATQRLLGCHVVGERAVEIVQLAAVAIAAGMPVGDILKIPFSFPIYPGVLFRALSQAARAIAQPLGSSEVRPQDMHS